MDCPICDEKMKLGFVKIQDAGFNILNNVTWYPIEEKDKKIHKKYVSLDLNAEGFYCETCMHVVAIIKQK